MNINSFISKFGHEDIYTRPLNDVDFLVFAELSYINMELLLPEGKRQITLKDIDKSLLDKKEVYEGSVDASKNKTMLKKMVSSVRYQDIVIKHIKKVTSKKNAEQFYALTIILPDKKKVFSFRGTDTTLLGWREDFNMLYQTVLSSHTEAIKYFNKYVDEAPYYIVGHSKGGNIAFYVALNMEVEYADRLIHAYSFDGPGFREGIEGFKAYEANRPKLIKYITHRDAVGLVFNNIGDFKIIYSNGFLLGGHDPFYWQIHSNTGEFVYRDKIKPSAIKSHMRFMQWLSTLSAKDRIFFISTLYVVFDGNETIYDLLRNFLNSLRRINQSLLHHHYSEKDKKKFKHISFSLFKFYVGIDDINKMKKREQKKNLAQYKRSARYMETDRLIIDEIRPEDKQGFFDNIAHDKKVLETFMCKYADNIDEFDFTIYLNRHGLFAIRLRETYELIGVITYFDENETSCEMGYAIGSSYWNKGYVTEALNRFIEFCFTERRFVKLYASFFVGNDASKRVMEKCGMKYDRYEKKAIEYHGKKQDLTYYVIEKK